MSNALRLDRIRGKPTHRRVQVRAHGRWQALRRGRSAYVIIGAPSTPRKDKDIFICTARSEAEAYMIVRDHYGLKDTRLRCRLLTAKALVSLLGSDPVEIEVSG